MTGLKRFRCYYGTAKKPCGMDLKAAESAIVQHAVEHLRAAHKRFAASCDDLEARVRDEIEDDVAHKQVGQGPVCFACQDLAPAHFWRCEFVHLGATPGECARAGLEHFATAHPRLTPDEKAIRAAVRVATIQKAMPAPIEKPLHVLWAKR
jgi:hypothetical protein